MGGRIRKADGYDRNIVAEPRIVLSDMPTGGRAAAANGRIFMANAQDIQRQPSIERLSIVYHLCKRCSRRNRRCEIFIIQGRKYHELHTHPLSPFAPEILPFAFLSVPVYRSAPTESIVYPWLYFTMFFDLLYGVALELNGSIKCDDGVLKSLFVRCNIADILHLGNRFVRWFLCRILKHLNGFDVIGLIPCCLAIDL